MMVSTASHFYESQPKGEGEHSRCRALAQVIDRIGNKWTVLVVGALSQGPARFNMLMRFVDGISHRMLTLTLRGLERDGLVKRTAYATIPPRVEYELTTLGDSLIAPLELIANWAVQNRAAVETARASFDARRNHAV